MWWVACMTYCTSYCVEDVLISMSSPTMSLLLYQHNVNNRKDRRGAKLHWFRESNSSSGLRNSWSQSNCMHINFRLNMSRRGTHANRTRLFVFHWTLSLSFTAVILLIRWRHEWIYRTSHRLFNLCIQLFILWAIEVTKVAQCRTARCLSVIFA